MKDKEPIEYGTLESLPRELGICALVTIIFILYVLLVAKASAQDCNECPEGFTPGQGTVTVNFTQKTYYSTSQVCEFILCHTITLTGTKNTDGLATYDAVLVEVTGNSIASDNECCSFLAPTVTPLVGDITAYLGGSIDVSWVPEEGGTLESVFLNGGTATCTTFQLQDNDFDTFVQVITTASASFTGGQCEDENGDPPDDPDDGGGPGDPDDPTDNDDPDLPDGGDNDPEPPDPPDVPDDSDGPDGDMPDDPPTDDECCIAITTRLDIVNQWLQYQTGFLDNIDENIYSLRESQALYYDHLMYDENAFLRVLVNNSQDIEQYLEAVHDLAHDQTWYLEQLYERLVNEDQDDPGIPSDPEDYEFQSFDPTTAYTLRGSHETSMQEQNQEFGLPDIEPYLPQESAQAPIWDWEVTLPITNYVMPVYVDFAPMTPIRNAVHLAVELLAGINAIGIVASVIKK
jgi:hypothetical protein